MSYNMIEGKNLILSDEGLFEPILETTEEGRGALERSRMMLMYEKQTQAIVWNVGDMHYCIFCFPKDDAIVYMQMEEELAVKNMIEEVKSCPRASLFGLKSDWI